MRLPWVSRKHHELVITRVAAALRQERDAARHDLAIFSGALEAERQWRLTSLPALLAAEERAVQAEARCAELEAAVTRELTTQFPELRPHAALADAYHESKERP